MSSIPSLCIVLSYLYLIICVTLICFSDFHVYYSLGNACITHFAPCVMYTSTPCSCNDYACADLQQHRKAEPPSYDLPKKASDLSELDCLAYAMRFAKNAKHTTVYALMESRMQMLLTSQMQMGSSNVKN